MANKIEFQLNLEDQEACTAAFAVMLGRILNLDDQDAAVDILRALTDPGILEVDLIELDE